ncbi:MAG: hypothetical protein Crog4KO_06300 [Crocinitomicaceae bacterium]
MRSLFGCLVLFVIVSFNGNAQGCPDSCELYVPNNVTPDCGGIDCHYLDIQSNCTLKKYELTVFNQWGEIVFESKNPKIKFSAKEFEEAVYLWQLKGMFCNGEKIVKRGYVSVLK